MSSSASSPVTASSTRNDAPRVRVFRHLRGQILSGALPEGEPLPAERDLATQLKVNRPALRWALEALEDEGLVRRQGSRTRLVARNDTMMQDTIVVVGEEVAQPHPGHRQPGWMEFLTVGSIRRIGEAGYNLLSLHPRRINDATMERLVASRPLGAVIAEVTEDFPHRQRLVARLTEVGTRVVSYGSSEEVAGYDRVSSDHEVGSYELTRWLIEQGRRRPLMLFTNTTDLYWVRERRAGYERAMHEAGLEPLPLVPIKVSTETHTREQLDVAARQIAGFLVEWMTGPAPIDALVLETDGRVPTAGLACRLFGREPNQDVLLVGYDNYWQDMPERSFEVLAPAATADKRNPELGQAMVDLLVQRIHGELPDEPQVRKLNPRIIIPGRNDEGYIPGQGQAPST